MPARSSKNTVDGDPVEVGRSLSSTRWIISSTCGGPDLVKLLTEDLREITGGVLHIETDANAAVEGIIGHIEEKRAKLGI
jgi:hypothetical protein